MPCLKKACPAGVQIHQRLLIFSVCHLPALVVHEISRRPPYPSTGTLSGLKRELFVCDATPPQPVSMAIRHMRSDAVFANWAGKVHLRTVVSHTSELEDRHRRNLGDGCNLFTEPHSTIGRCPGLCR